MNLILFFIQKMGCNCGPQNVEYVHVLTVRNYIVGFSWGFQGLHSLTVNFRYVGTYGRGTVI
ncbi:hypothetical protein BCE33L3088 [Bacillus cereus E33L]|uniref:Uncharacterized protein n=1 Tax=Bacillus cereus (strain ZK / E33L) TaxID=288681 RepID=Q638J2_BACCZ|nr:hypothetical protein BCE33L3088 [Bacillus cereus E33L]